MAAGIRLSDGMTTRSDRQLPASWPRNATIRAPLRTISLNGNIEPARPRLRLRENNMCGY
jgi:hypothetical protein